MAETSVPINTSTDVAAPRVATDRIGGKDYQEIKVGWGVANTYTGVEDSASKRLPINVSESTLIGAVDETAPASDVASSGLNGRLQRIAQALTSFLALFGAINEAAPAGDTANSGLNGRLQRIAQRLTSLIALLPAALTSLGALKTGPAEGIATATVTVGSATSAAVDTAGMRNLGLIVPPETDGTSLTFTVAVTLGGTYYPLRDITGAAVTLPVTAGSAYDVPGELTFARFVKIVCSTNQTTTDTVFVWIYRS